VSAPAVLLVGAVSEVETLEAVAAYGADSSFKVT
jgi:hypothetical protein